MKSILDMSQEEIQWCYNLARHVSEDICAKIFKELRRIEKKHVILKIYVTIKNPAILLSI